jgi:D-glycero-D-manno-heptose 1,7-bisphosphate phosphatase
MPQAGTRYNVGVAHDLTLELAQSWMIGDTVSDMLVGRNVGCRSILARTGYGNCFARTRDCIDHFAINIAQAAQITLGALSKKDNP